MNGYRRKDRRDSSKRFDKDIERSSRFSRDRDDRRDSRSDFEKKMFRVTCDKCGTKCEVPFKPTEGKPVYCDDCFRSKNSSRRDNDGGYERRQAPQQQSSARDYSKELDEINEKLDKIISALQIDD